MFHIGFKLVPCIVFLVQPLSALNGDASAKPPEMVDAYNALNRGDSAYAADVARHFLKLHPNNSAMHVVLARTELGTGQIEAAVEELQKALISNPQNIDAHYYLWLAGTAQSEKEFQQLFAMSPEYYRVHQLLGEAALAVNRVTEAEDEFLAALKARPNSVEVLTELADLQRSQSRFDEAIGNYLKAVKTASINYDVAYGLGVCYTYRREFDLALEYLSTAVRLDPRSPDSRFALGNAWLESGKPDAAVRELEHAALLKPDMDQAYFLLGRAYRKLGRKKDADAAFMKIRNGAGSAR